MIVSGLSGNEIWCLKQKGFDPGEIVVGNSVASLGIAGGVGAAVRGVTGGEIAAITRLISEGRHLAIERMEAEAQRHGAVGISGVESTLGHLSGYMEFLSQGTALSAATAQPPVVGGRPLFSTAASGMELYCHLDAGYQPVRFAMGNVAYALGLGRGLTGSLRTLGRGEVHEFSQMYNHIRHLALERLRAEAAGIGANAVVDVDVQILPWGPAVELLMTGTASFHPRLGPASPESVVTSELSGEELWNLASLGYVPVQLVMSTSVYSLGVVGGIGALFQGMARGELPQLTKLVYEARENCVDLLRKEAAKYGAERVIGNRLSIRELSPGLVEVLALGTAVRRMERMEPASPALVVQAIIVERESLESAMTRSEGNIPGDAMARASRAPGAAQQLFGVLVALAFLGGTCGLGVIGALAELFR